VLRCASGGQCAWRCLQERLRKAPILHVLQSHGPRGRCQVLRGLCCWPLPQRDEGAAASLPPALSASGTPDPAARVGVQLQEDRMWASWMDVAFAKLDANGDGYISLEELLARLPDAVDGPAAAVEGERLNAARPSHTC